MAFGRAFETRKEAEKFLNERFNQYRVDQGHINGYGVRLMPKRLFPRRKRRYHVGTYLDYINFA
jgi:hypothetical protein